MRRRERPAAPAARPSPPGPRSAPPSSSPPPPPPPTSRSTTSATAPPTPATPPARSATRSIQANARTTPPTRSPSPTGLSGTITLTEGDLEVSTRPLIDHRHRHQRGDDLGRRRQHGGDTRLLFLEPATPRLTLNGLDLDRRRRRRRVRHKYEAAGGAILTTYESDADRQRTPLITDSYADYGGGGSSTSAASVTITNSEISGNGARPLGGGVRSIGREVRRPR